MMKSVAGTYRQGKIELLEPAPDGVEGKVIVTFLSSGGAVDLQERGINPAQAAELRTRLSAFEEDWSRPEMDVYDADPPR
jgi:hypothetical protein